MQANFVLYFVALSATFLLPPAFSVEHPAAINYGSLGMTIGHEIVHGLIFLNRVDFDKPISMHTERYINMHACMTRCFTALYGGLLEPITGIKINGEQTLSENIADNVGVKQAYRSFEAQLSTCADCGAPIGGQFSAEQLFFIAYGQAYCGNHRNSSKLHRITQIDSHSPFKFRVNIPLANLDQFAHAFNCPVGSGMNPEQKCLFW